MSTFKKVLFGLLVSLTAVMPVSLTAAESMPITKAVIQENTTTNASNVYWRGGGRWYGHGYYGRGYGWGGGYYPGYYGGYYSSYPYYGYSSPYYGYGYGCGDCY